MYISLLAITSVSDIRQSWQTYTALQRQTTVTAYFVSKQLLLFAFAGHVQLLVISRPEVQHVFNVGPKRASVSCVVLIYLALIKCWSIIYVDSEGLRHSNHDLSTLYAGWARINLIIHVVEKV